MEERIIIAPAVTSEAMSQVLDIRYVVFTREQGIPPALDHDGKDETAVNLLLRVGHLPAGTGRLVIEGQRGVLARIAVLPAFRSRGLAKLIITELEMYGSRSGVTRFELHPHKYLEKFYAGMGYVTDPQWHEVVAGHELIKMFKDELS